MRLTIASGRRSGGIASFVAPVIVLALAKGAGLGPIASQATPIDSGDEGPQDASTDRVRATAAEPLLRAASDSGSSMARSRELCEQSAESLPSPFYQRSAAAEMSGAASAPVQPTGAAAPTFVLGGVMNGRPSVAVIDGNVYRPGDSLGGGWSIESIDARRLVVTLRHADGRVHLLATGQP